MESLLAVASLAAAGLTLMLLTLRPRSSPPWPPLHEHTHAHADDNGSSSETADDDDEPTPADVSHPLVTSQDASHPSVTSQDSTQTTIRNGVKSRLLRRGKEEEEDDDSGSSSTSPCLAKTTDGCGEKDTIDSSPTNTTGAIGYAGDTSTDGVTSSVVSKSSAGSKAIRSLPASRQRRVLFVIAHPDDECMFFGPSILHFTQKEKAMVFLICLTNGSYNSSKIGRVRQQELWASCEVLGIPAGHITLYKCRHLPDHPSKSWPVVTTANIINRHLHMLQCDMVVTFDGGGVSGHINHRSLYSSLCYLLEARLMPPECSAYRLDTVNVVRKYSSVLDFACSFLCSSHLITADTAQYCTIRTAMRAHASQYVWFRKLYMLFSRYVVINTLSLMKPCTKADSIEW